MKKRSFQGEICRALLHAAMTVMQAVIYVAAMLFDGASRWISAVAAVFALAGILMGMPAVFILSMFGTAAAAMAVPVIAAWMICKIDAVKQGMKKL